MGKRSSFERRPLDFYPTPEAGVLPLLDYLKPCQFIEPCCGDGALIGHLEKYGFKCIHRSDISAKHDALDLTSEDLPSAPIITNPPWSRSILHEMIRHFSSMRTTWLLFDADWPHTKQSADLMRYCHEIVPVGRLKWVPGSPHTGKDNCCWYRFELFPGDAILRVRKPQDGRKASTISTYAETTSASLGADLRGLRA